MGDRFQELEDIAHKLNRLKQDPNARVNYELMSDGLIWSDELPPVEDWMASETCCLRGIWRFRTSLIIGEPVEKFRRSWEKGQELFPNWPGFLPERQSAKWRELFVTRREKLIADWKALDARFERQKASQTSDSAAAS